MGTGAGGFGAATNFAAGTGPLSVTVGDFNGDGKADLVTANYGSNNVSVLLGGAPAGTITPSLDGSNNLVITDTDGTKNNNLTRPRSSSAPAASAEQCFPTATRR